jgi:hypothetical protein
LRTRIRWTAKRAVAATTTFAAAAALALAGAPSAAAADGATVDLGHVGATYFTGTVNFTNRSVSVDGVIRALSTSCRRVYASAYDANANPLGPIRSTSTWCTTSPAQHIPLEANVPGGAAIVVVEFTDAAANQIDICSVVRGETACT